MVDIHNYQRQAERTLRNIEISSLSIEQKRQIKEFYNHCLLEGISYGKVSRYLQELKKSAFILKKDFDKCEKKDIENLIIHIEKEDYSEWTKCGFKLVIRKFFKWLRETEDLPPEVKWIKIKLKKSHRKLPDELLTEEEVMKMIEVSENARDKALISILYESGCRIGEILTLRMRNIIFDELGAKISVFGKTGSRRIRIISSIPYLHSWINEHPNKNSPESFMWIKSKKENELVGYDRIRVLIARLAKKAGIKKRVNPHSFRHARASFLANHLTESQLKEVFGWDQASKMASVYVHLSGRNTDEAILRVHGKEFEIKKKESCLSSKECTRCRTLNEATNRFCKLCGLPLDKDIQHEILKKEFEDKSLNALMENLLKDKKVIEFLKNGLKNNISHETF